MGGAAPTLKANRVELHTVVNHLTPELTDRPGIGPVSVAQAISRAGRCRSDATFAKLAGTSPLEASCGKTTRHRLNRGGDRAPNETIHVIATTRMRSDPTMGAYVARRSPQGKSTKEIRRASRATWPASSTEALPPG